MLGSAKDAIPVLMFHKVDENPRYPEDITTDELKRLFNYFNKKDFVAINISDILENRVDKIVPKGLKPVCITADDSHESIIASKSDRSSYKNNHSFLDTFVSICPNARCTLFLTPIGDDRTNMASDEYFGGFLPLKEALKMIGSMSDGIEFGYHTKTHKRMKEMNALQTRELLQEQIDQFEKLGVLDMVEPILAYPYGVPPNADGIEELKKMGFKGAVIARPGNYEAKYKRVEECYYDGELKVDRFLIPRVSIGTLAYAKKGFETIGAMDDFFKDLPRSLYVSRG